MYNIQKNNQAKAGENQNMSSCSVLVSEQYRFVKWYKLRRKVQISSITLQKNSKLLVSSTFLGTEDAWWGRKSIEKGRIELLRPQRVNTSHVVHLHYMLTCLLRYVAKCMFQLRQCRNDPKATTSPPPHPSYLLRK